MGRGARPLIRPRIITGGEGLIGRKTSFVLFVEASLGWQLVAACVLFITRQQGNLFKTQMWPCDSTPSLQRFPKTQHLAQAAKHASQPAGLRTSCPQPHPPLQATLLLILPLCWDPFSSPRAPSPPTGGHLHRLSRHLDSVTSIPSPSQRFSSLWIHRNFYFSRNSCPQTSDCVRLCCYPSENSGFLSWVAEIPTVILHVFLSNFD